MVVIVSVASNNALMDVIRLKSFIDSNKSRIHVNAIAIVLINVSESSFSFPLNSKFHISLSVSFLRNFEKYQQLAMLHSTLSALIQLSDRQVPYNLITIRIKNISCKFHIQSNIKIYVKVSTIDTNHHFST